MAWTRPTPPPPAVGVLAGRLPPVGVNSVSRFVEDGGGRGEGFCDPAQGDGCSPDLRPRTAETRPTPGDDRGVAAAGPVPGKRVSRGVSTTPGEARAGEGACASRSSAPPSRRGGAALALAGCMGSTGVLPPPQPALGRNPCRATKAAAAAAALAATLGEGTAGEGTLGASEVVPATSEDARSEAGGEAAGGGAGGENDAGTGAAGTGGGAAAAEAAMTVPMERRFLKPGLPYPASNAASHSALPSVPAPPSVFSSPCSALAPAPVAPARSKATSSTSLASLPRNSGRSSLNSRRISQRQCRRRPRKGERCASMRSFSWTRTGTMLSQTTRRRSPEKAPRAASAPEAPPVAAEAAPDPALAPAPLALPSASGESSSS
mmetsp:Transcript_24862/g.78476  ORF Transcript_24862/g.78476 Transcript_24862/m.78476 type:complete len:377 (-) Transcript_24862:919-2049(-)